MSRIWIVSEDRRFRETLAGHLAALGPVWTGAPERGDWKDAPTPDLAVLLAVEAPSGELAGLERLLGFVRAIPTQRRAPAPVLYLEPASGHPPGELAASLIDDRPVAVSGWPIEPDRIVSECAALLDQPDAPLSLRERARREWVTERVERLYAGLELPDLRLAIDPRNAARPVLLIGEPGTGRGLLARYIHNLAEPPRDALLIQSARALPTADVESYILERSARRRTTLYLEELDRAPRELQAELAHSMSESGLLGVEPIRWIASALRAGGVTGGLQWLNWLRVELPPLRERPDLGELAREMTRAAGAAAGRVVALDDAGVARLAEYAWPGNLRELEAVLAASVAATRGERLGADDLRIGPSFASVGIGHEPLPAEVVEDDRDEDLVEVAPEPDEGEGEERLEWPPPFPEDEASELEEASPEHEPELLAPDREAPLPSLALSRLTEITAPLAQELRQPLLALHTCATLLDQRPDDPSVRRELMALVDGDLTWVESSLQRLEDFADFDEPVLDPVDLAALAGSELEQRRATMRARSLVVLEELDREAPPALADEAQLRFALGALLDRALRMVPTGGDLYFGTAYLPDGHHRLLLRFHSPEDVLVPPEGVPAPPMPLEVVFARLLIERMGGTFAVDASGAQDNVVLIELPPL